MKLFVTGISTEVGKTIASAIIVEALEADYWKPVQAGDLEHSDSHTIKKLVSNPKTTIHPNSYGLKTPMSPHAAARLDKVTIDMQKIIEPQTDNHLVIEGAGGLLVPLNDSKTILDLIQPDYKVVVVSRHYLGSINHTLLTLHLLKEKGVEVSLIFNGYDPESYQVQTTEHIISKMTGIPVIGHIENEPYFDDNVIKEYAEKFKPFLNENG
ncbi:MAG: dethiobiotin synthase [Bacteroidota bacterium]